MSATSSSACSSLDSIYYSVSERGTWTDASSMSTPPKPGVNGLSNQRRDPALRADVHYKDVTLEHFIEHIWGVSQETITKLLAANWALDETAFVQYDNVLDPSNTLRESDLHAPFRAIASKLVLDAHIVLGNFGASLVEHFWDGNGTTILSSKHTKRKPDLLSLWGPVPIWANTKSAVEFKIEAVSLPVISPSAAAEDHRLKEKKESEHRHSWVTAMFTSRTSRISSVDSRLDRSSNISITSRIRRLKRLRSVEDDGDAVSVASVSKRPRHAANYVTQDQLHLAAYALECLSVSSRQYATGLFINSRKVTLWYFDRIAVIRTVAFDFGKDRGPAQLALTLYALSQCDVRRAGFNPYLHRISLPEDEDAIIPESAIQPLEKPSSNLAETCLVFPESGNLKSRRYFLLRDVIYAYRGLVGRGCMVYETLAGIIGSRLPKEVSILKLSWQCLFRKHEGEIITHLRNAIPAWKDHLPELSFSATFSAEELGLPWVRMMLEDLGNSRIKLRRLDVIASHKYENLWKAGSIEHFKRAFIDCVECHYHAYTTGRVLHRDLSDNNLMLWHPKLGSPDPPSDSPPGTTRQTISPSMQDDDAPDQPSVLGILNDWDMASELTDEGEVLNSATLHRTGTLPFMAIDLLGKSPPPHYYRHDLESFFYILVWAAIHYDLKNMTRRPTTSTMILSWGAEATAQNSKLSLLIGGARGNDYKQDIMKLIRKEFSDICVQWILPLRTLFITAFESIPESDQPKFSSYNHATCNGQITFQSFMAALGVKPRSP